MQAQMKQQKFGDKACNKPGQGKPSASDMKKMQEQLNKRLKKGMNGNMNSKELVQLAAKQEAIRRALQQMQHQLTKDAKGGAGKGDLKKIQDLMEQTETETKKSKAKPKKAIKKDKLKGKTTKTNGKRKTKK